MTGSLGAIIYGIIGGLVGWFATDFLARPIRQFFQLRGEICEAAVMFDNVRAGDVTRLKEARDAFRELGARMLAFGIGRDWGKSRPDADIAKPTQMTSVISDSGY